MKVVRIEHGVVAEVIPAYALPVERWYGAAFAEMCVEAPDEVGQRWRYDAEAGVFSAPAEAGETPDEPAADEPTLDERVEALEGETAELNEALSMILEGVTE